MSAIMIVTKYLHKHDDTFDLALEMKVEYDELCMKIKDLKKENNALQVLLDLRDEEYFKWCENGVVPQPAADREKKE